MDGIVTGVIPTNLPHPLLTIEYTRNYLIMYRIFSFNPRKQQSLLFAHELLHENQEITGMLRPDISG